MLVVLPKGRQTSTNSYVKISIIHDKQIFDIYIILEKFEMEHENNKNNYL